ncbi:MAG: hypothetical protein NW207_04350 [Cytophagales bacterium]|nr:hypothetical protein [Cytophagales bacterium]
MAKKYINIDKIEKTVPYLLPDSYFDTLQYQVFFKITKGISLEKKYTNEEIFALPVQYFETSVNDILSKTSEQLLLQDIPKLQAINVADTYFDELPLKIQTRIYKSKPDTYTIPQLLWKPALATIALVFTLSLSYYIYLQYTPTNYLSGIETNDIISFLENADNETYNTIAMEIPSHSKISHYTATNVFDIEKNEINAENLDIELLEDDI